MIEERLHAVELQRAPDSLRARVLSSTRTGNEERGSRWRPWYLVAAVPILLALFVVHRSTEAELRRRLSDAGREPAARTPETAQPTELRSLLCEHTCGFARLNLSRYRPGYGDLLGGPSIVRGLRFHVDDMQ